MVTVNYCCCGLLSLRTGILIFLGLDAAFVVCFIFGTLVSQGLGFVQSAIVVIGLIILVIHGIGIYGTVKEKPELLVPLLVYLVVGMVFMIMLMIIWAIVSFLFLLYVAVHDFLKIDMETSEGMNGTETSEEMNKTQTSKSMNRTKTIKEKNQARPFEDFNMIKYIAESIYRESFILLGLALYIYMFIVVKSFKEKLNEPKALKAGKEETS